MGAGSFPGLKWPRRDAEPSAPSSVKVLKQSRAIFLLFLRAFVACENMKPTYQYLTAFGLTPGGSSTVHIYTQTVQQYSTHLHTNSTQNKTMSHNTQNGTAITIRIVKLTKEHIT
jgi:cytochrome c biogenesis factor